MDVLTLLDKLSGVGLPFIAVAILYGGWKKYWVWGYQLEASERLCEKLLADKDKQLEDERRDKNEWKAVVFEIKGLAVGSMSALSKVVEHKGP